MPKRNPKKLSDQIRQAVVDSKVSRYRIWKDTGIDQSVLGKFVSGERGISMETLDVLAEYLGLRIMMDRKPNKRRK